MNWVLCLSSSVKVRTLRVAAGGAVDEVLGVEDVDGLGAGLFDGVDAGGFDDDLVDRAAAVADQVVAAAPNGTITRCRPAVVLEYTGNFEVL